MTENVSVYTDGACTGNPGPGGYGAIIDGGGRRRELSGGFRCTTNNRMEITAVIVALEALKSPVRVTVYSDSQYLVKAMSLGWASRWRTNGWMRTKTEPALNPDLWEQLLLLCEKHRDDFKWVRGHNAHPENERCDALATGAAGRPGLPADTGYETSVRRLL